MDLPPNSFNTKTISRAGLAGAVLSALGILLFVGLWLVTGRTDLDPFPRLIISLCVPPGVIAIVMGIYALVVRPSSTEPPQS